jgi:RNA polymerase sigma factor (sigma-70 family)
MGRIQANALWKHICQVINTSRQGGQIDRLLLDEFASRRDDGAFAALVHRHGPLVFSVCNRVLRDLHDAEDAFQATFLVLARKAASIRKPQALNSWLYGVAYRLAIKAKTQAARRRLHEANVTEETAAEPSADPTWSELRGLLDDELNRLPAKYRAPLLLCYFEGKTLDEAARDLNWSLGTFRRRLDQGRELLRARLTSRGLAFSAVLFPALLTQEASAAVSAHLQAETCRAALLFHSGTTTVAGAVSPHITALAEGLMKTMFVSKLKVAAGLLLALGLAALGFGLLGQRMAAAPLVDTAQAPDDTPRPPTGLAKAKEQVARAQPAGADKPAPLAQSTFPRSLLAISVNNYAFAEPVSFAAGDRCFDQLAELLRIPASQAVLLSDKAPRREVEPKMQPYPPTKAIIEEIVGQFLASRDPQERVVLSFVGHAVEIDEQPYLVPLDGDTGSKQTLIPLAWLYDQLNRCKARQKVLILDVCRFNAVLAEPGTVAKMSKKTDAMLNAPPKGVQVLTACTAGEYSLELPTTNTPDGLLEGGIMQSQILVIKQHGGLKGIIQRPEESIPVQSLATILGARTGAIARAYVKSEQTVRLSGAEAESNLVFDPKWASPPRFEIKLSGMFAKGVATQAEMQAFFKEIAGLPPVKRTQVNIINFDKMPPFPADQVQAYKDDSKDTPLREKVREAIVVLKENNQQFQEVFLRNFDPNNQQQASAFKAQLQQIQMNASLIQLKLDTILDELEQLQKDRALEPKRWQAIFDFVRARLAAKIAYVYEYNAKLGTLRVQFPPIDPTIHKGWQLAAALKLTDRDADKYAIRAQSILTQLAKDHSASPWAWLARREQLTGLGLEWQPSPK